MKPHHLLYLLLAGSLVLSNTAQAEETPSASKPAALSSCALWEFSSSMTYESGDFDTDKTTHTVYIPFTLTRYFKEGDAYLTIPYIYQESPREVTAIRGRPFQTSRIRTNTRKEEGLGDVILGGSYYLMNEKNEMANLDVVGSLKLPTADEDKGLGTGEFDETFGLESSKSLDNEWKLYLDLYYTFIGEPKHLDLHNQATFDFGAGYRINEKTEVRGYYSESTALLDDLDNPRSLSGYLFYTYDEQISFNGGISLGVSDGSPAFGMTGGLGLKF